MINIDIVAFQQSLRIYYVCIINNLLILFYATESLIRNGDQSVCTEICEDNLIFLRKIYIILYYYNAMTWTWTPHSNSTALAHLAVFRYTEALTRDTREVVVARGVVYLLYW